MANVPILCTLKTPEKSLEHWLTKNGLLRNGEHIMNQEWERIKDSTHQYQLVPLNHKRHACIRVKTFTTTLEILNLLDICVANEIELLLKMTSFEKLWIIYFLDVFIPCSKIALNFQKKKTVSSATGKLIYPFLANLPNWLILFSREALFIITQFKNVNIFFSSKSCQFYL